MTETDIKLFSDLWGRLVGGDFTLQCLAQRIHRDGGIDMSNLSEEDVLQLLNGRFAGDWHEPAFSFSELLACYAAGEGNDMTKEQMVGWVAGAFVVADAINQNATDLELQFNIFFEGFLVVRNKLGADECIHILRRFLCRER